MKLAEPCGGFECMELTLTEAQKRILCTMESAGTSSLMALERKGLVRWTGSIWVRTDKGNEIAKQLRSP